MDGSKIAEQNIDRAATLKNCLVYLLRDAKEAELGWCALHLKIAISELNSVIGNESPGTSGQKGVSLCGHQGVKGSGSQLAPTE